MIKIDFKFTTLNDYIEAERGWYKDAADIKKIETHAAMLLVRGKKIETPCKLRFIWHVKDRRRDADNIAFCKKYILDGMVKAKVIPNDNLVHITGLVDDFVVDGREYVEVIRL